MDPLIKSQHNIFDLMKNFFQLAAKCAVGDQKVASNFPTAECDNDQRHEPARYVGMRFGAADGIENTTWKERTVTNAL